MVPSDTNLNVNIMIFHKIMRKIYNRLHLYDVLIQRKRSFSINPCARVSKFVGPNGRNCSFSIMLQCGERLVKEKLFL